MQMDDPWVQAPLTGLVFLVIYVALGTLLFNEPVADSALLGGVGAVVFTFVYGVYLNRIR